ncbi:unnamed protein product [Cuscuta epithymum]|uniref:VQ domain-containing protein n=1 Tax=Cuscuta epithymum TaxID=186058 RepID=A0AAV0EWQ7_9ASTE|nr:unnamed protein product [Cuscuta epithymum]
MQMKKGSSADAAHGPTKIGFNKDSLTKISKPKPKIRIIHIFAPEIIKTDVQNFRELVQRLTGKPPEKKKKPAGALKRLTAEPAKRVELREEEICGGGGFLSGLQGGEFDGFFMDDDAAGGTLSSPFPVLPLDLPADNPAGYLI